MTGITAAVQEEWLHKVLHSLEAMKKQLNETPWSFKRSDTLKRLLREKWSEIGTLENAFFHAAGIVKEKTRLIRPVYSAGNLFDLLLEKVDDDSLKPEEVYQFAPVPESLLCIRYLIEFKFTELEPRYNKSDFNRKTSRSDDWLKLLNIPRELDLFEKKRYQRLQEHVYEHQLFTDLLIFKDIKNTAVDDDYYFVFEDFLHQIMMIFSRDPEVVQYAYRNVKTLKFEKPAVKGVTGKRELPYPPNGVIPFHGFSLLLAPLCYVFGEQELLFLVFKKIYCEYWVKLHTIQPDARDGIVGLCINVEQRLLRKVPSLVQHLGKLDITISKMIFPWLFSAFSSLLPPSELLQLWDCIIRRRSLLPLADLTVAIFLWRESTLFSCEDAHSAETAVKDLKSVQVEPLFLYYFSR